MQCAPGTLHDAAASGVPKKHLLRQVLFLILKEFTFYKKFIVNDKVLCYDILDILDVL